jgi:hypothetical protein
MRNLIFALASTVGGVAFQMSVDAGWFKHYVWAVPWVWALCIALWLLWAISHPKVTDGRLKGFHVRVGRGIYVLRFALCLAAFVLGGIAIRTATRSLTQRSPLEETAAAAPALTPASQQQASPPPETVKHPSDLKKNIRKSKSASQGTVQENNGGSNNTNTQVGTAQGPIAIAPSGIANAVPNLGTQTINNNFPSSEKSVTQVRTEVTSFVNSAYEGLQEARDYETWVRPLPISEEKKRVLIGKAYEDFAKDYNKHYGPQAIDMRRALLGHIQNLPRGDSNAEYTYKQYDLPPDWPKLNEAGIEMQLKDLRTLLNEMEQENGLPLSCQNLFFRF